MSPEVHDLRVTTADPRLLDETLHQLPGPLAVVVDGSFDGTACTVRVLGNPGFLVFALANQGYGELLSCDRVSPAVRSGSPSDEET